MVAVPEPREAGSAGSAASDSEGPGTRGVFALVFRFLSTHFLPWSQDLGCATFDERVKNPVVEKSRHSPGHRALWIGMRWVPIPQGGVPQSKSRSPEPFTRGSNRGLGVFPGIRPKQRHSGNPWEEPRGWKMLLRFAVGGKLCHPARDFCHA